MSFIDEAKFFVKAGDGGNGCVSFRREKFVPRGGPDGGDGGKGGDVIIEVSSRLTSLLDFKYRSHFLAEKGTGGKGRKMHGRGGEDCLVLVPPGTVLRDVETGEILADLVRDGQRLVAARGGRGGKGNVHFASASNRAPRIATKGKPGEEFWFRIELKLIADVGLIGLPNAGKSTLLAQLTAATPKVADYPFTTLSPQLGVLFFPDRPPCTIADIPGLIEDAHLGAGLGHTFLRHIERTRLLLQVIDASGRDGDPLEQYRMLENELAQYQADLLRRPRLVLLNKIDLLNDDGDQLRELQERFTQAGIEVLPVSALGGQGMPWLIGEISRHLARVEPAAEEPAAEEEEP
ncbi:MAG: GTPase ObgE [Desulfurivibrio sp.]